MESRHTYLVLARPADASGVIELEVPELSDTVTAAFDILEGEVLVRQAIALAIGTTETESFEVDIRVVEPGD